MRGRQGNIAPRGSSRRIAALIAKVALGELSEAPPLKPIAAAAAL